VRRGRRVSGRMLPEFHAVRGIVSPAPNSNGLKD
jgi:hypothetical protein